MQQQDVGTVITVTLTDSAGAVVDVSTATNKQILLRTPAGSVLTNTATFTTDGEDGKIKYSVGSNVLKEDGNWEIQANMVLTAGSWRSSIGTFKVNTNIEY